MIQTRNLLGMFENKFWLFIQSVNLFTSRACVDSVNHLSFLWPIKMLPFVWRQNKPIRCWEKLLIMADMFLKVMQNNTAHFLVCFTPHFPSKSKALPACCFRFVVKNKSCTAFCMSVLLTDNAIKCSKPCSETTRYAHCSTCSFEHFMTSSVINKNTDNRTAVHDLLNNGWHKGC